MASEGWHREPFEGHLCIPRPPRPDRRAKGPAPILANRSGHAGPRERDWSDFSARFHPGEVAIDNGKAMRLIEALPVRPSSPLPPPRRRESRLFLFPFEARRHPSGSHRGAFPASHVVGKLAQPVAGNTTAPQDSSEHAPRIIQAREDPPVENGSAGHLVKTLSKGPQRPQEVSAVDRRNISWLEGRPCPHIVPVQEMPLEALKTSECFHGRRKLLDRWSKVRKPKSCASRALNIHKPMFVGLVRMPARHAGRLDSCPGEATRIGK